MSWEVLRPPRESSCFYNGTETESSQTPTARLTSVSLPGGEFKRFNLGTHPYNALTSLRSYSVVYNSVYSEAGEL